MILQKESRKSMKLREALTGKRSNEEIISKKQLAAIEHKNKLLEYDNTCAKRTQVIDDESDYYFTGVGSWLTKEERDTISSEEKRKREKRYSSRLNKKSRFKCVI